VEAREITAARGDALPGVDPEGIPASL